MNEDYRTYARVGYFYCDHLLEIAIDSVLVFESSITENELLKGEGHFIHHGITIYKEIEKIQDLENSLLKESIKIVTFLSAFLESYFFEFAAITLGQKYAENYIEKLDLPSKIMIVTRLVTGKEIDTSLHFWGEIKNLIKWRNRIIHNKTKDAIAFLKETKSHYDPKPLYEEFSINEFTKSIKILFEELDKIDPKGLHSSRINMSLKRIKGIIQ